MRSYVLWWAPFGVFLVFWAVIGFRYGSKAVSTTETEVINRYAAQYLEDAGEGAELTDCIAYPSSELGIWLVVSCAPPLRALPFEYHVNRVGSLGYFDRPALRSLQEPQA